MSNLELGFGDKLMAPEVPTVLKKLVRIMKETLIGVVCAPPKLYKTKAKSLPLWHTCQVKARVPDPALRVIICGPSDHLAFLLQRSDVIFCW